MTKQDNKTPWQSIPGSSAQLKMLAYAKNCLSSNAYIIKAAQCLVIIDPGTYPDQLHEIQDTVQEYLQQTTHPVFFILTHCHYDHSKGLASMPFNHPRVFIAVQENGAEALRNADPLLIISYIFGDSCEAVPVDIELCEKQDLRTCRPRKTASGRHLTTRKILDISPPVIQQSMPLSDTEDITFYYTPGHSSDSICLQVGTYLFLGDLLFAAQPGVAGIIGWNGTQVVNSCTQVNHIIQQQGITLCLNGHGPTIPADKALELSEKILQESAAIGDLVVLDAKRSAFLKTYTQAAMRHITDLLTILSGQLYALSFELEKLDDQAQASNLLSTLDITAIDELLTRFSRKIDQYLQAPLQTTAPLKSLFTMSKLKKILHAHKLTDCVSPTLLLRIEHTMENLVNTVHGVPLYTPQNEMDLHDLLEEVIHDQQTSIGSTEDLMDMTEDPAAFSILLAQKIALPPILQGIDIQTQFEATHSLLNINKADLSDFLIDLFEAYSTAGLSALSLQTKDTPTGITLTITTTHHAPVAQIKTYLMAAAQMNRWGLAFNETDITLTFEHSHQ